jgi:hypothetical protein
MLLDIAAKNAMQSNTPSPEKQSPEEMVKDKRKKGG